MILVHSDLWVGTWWQNFQFKGGDLWKTLLSWTDYIFETYYSCAIYQNILQMFWETAFKINLAQKSDWTICIMFLLEDKFSKIKYSINSAIVNILFSGFQNEGVSFMYLPVSPLATEMKSHHFYARGSSVWFIWKRLIFVWLVPEEEPLHF